MKKTLIGVALASLIAGPVFAAENVKVTDYTKMVTKNIPHTQQVCSNVDVPIYGSTGHDNTGDILTGAIIGGVIGNNIKGERNGGAAGAVIGGLLGNAHGNKKNQGVVGYRQEHRCSNNTSYTTESYEVYDYSVIEFFENGRYYRLRFNKN